MAVTITGAQVLAHAKVTGAAAADSANIAWATTCAADVTALIAARVGSTTLSAGDESRLTRAGLQDGAAAYADRDAPHGIQSLGPDGEVVRLGRNVSRALEPVFLSILGPGIG